MRVTMTAPFRSEDGLSIWGAGTTQYPSTDYGKMLVLERRVATDPDGALVVPGQDNYLTTAQVQAVQAMAEVYSYQPATWHAGEINSVVTPSITADGDLTSATDQVPLKWLVVINADDDVAAAQALLDGGPNVIEILPGATAQPIVTPSPVAEPGTLPLLLAGLAVLGWVARRRIV